MIDLKQFCSTNPFLSYLHSPLSFGDYTFASNGAIIVRVDRRPDAAEGAPPMTEKGVHRVLALEPDLQYRALPKYAYPPVIISQCEFCDGTGKEEDHDDYWPCIACDGTGNAKPKSSLSVGGVAFDTQYLRNISVLPNIEIEKTTSERRALRFRFTGGVGALMPLIGPRANHIGNIED
jgi:hypothetical protein